MKTNSDQSSNAEALSPSVPHHPTSPTVSRSPKFARWLWLTIGITAGCANTSPPDDDDASDHSTPLIGDDDATHGNTPPEGDDDATSSADDGDGDGVSTEEGDCNDENPLVNPSATEVCDGIDSDCDGIIEGEDKDRDGFSREWCQSEWIGMSRGDCNDKNTTVYPGASDSSGDGIDADCGGTDGPDPHVGLGENSFTTIQAALDAAHDGETVWVGPGTYLEHELTMGGKAIVLISTEGATETTIKGGRIGTVILFVDGESEESTLDGFTLTGGNASYNCREDGACKYWGGGIFISRSNPTLKWLTLFKNYATDQGGGIYFDSTTSSLYQTDMTWNNALDGGGMYLYSSDPTIEQVVLEKNSASKTGGGIGMDVSNPTINTVTLKNNSAAWRGAGMDLSFSNPIISDTLLIGNEAAYDGGGAYFSRSNPHFTLSRFIGNIAGINGGGMFLFASNPSMDQMVVTENYADFSGGGLFMDEASPRMNQTVVAGNYAGYEGGGFCLKNSAPITQNSVIAYNSGEGYNIYNQTPDVLSQWRYNNLYQPESGKNLSGVVPDDTNLTAEPKFLIEPIFLENNSVWRFDDFHLSIDSPLVDAGAPDAVDPDGSRADIGLYGGPDADDWDSDRDGFNAYFWSGTIDDAPEGFNQALYDKDDGNSTIH